MDIQKSIVFLLLPIDNLKVKLRKPLSLNSITKNKVSRNKFNKRNKIIIYGKL